MEKAVHSSALYIRLLGDSWTKLAPAVRDLHRDDVAARAAGFMRVSRGENCLARWLAALLRLPAAGEAVPVTLVVTALADGEEWRRTFANNFLISRQRPRSDGLLAEQAGLIELRFRLEARNGGLVYHPAGAALRLGWLWVPLTRWLVPTVTARESSAGTPGQTEVSVRVSLPILGLLISYEGLMGPNGEVA